MIWYTIGAVSFCAPLEMLTCSSLQWPGCCLCLYSCWLDQVMDYAYLCLSRMACVCVQWSFMSQSMALTPGTKSCSAVWIRLEQNVFTEKHICTGCVLCLKDKIQQCGKHICLLSGRDLDVKIDTTLISVRYKAPASCRLSLTMLPCGSKSVPRAGVPVWWFGLRTDSSFALLVQTDIFNPMIVPVNTDFIVQIGRTSLRVRIKEPSLSLSHVGVPLKWFWSCF